MASGEDKQVEEFNSSMDTSMEDASSEDAREARRLRREQRNQEEDDPSLLDVSDDQEERGLPITRASLRREEEAAAEAAAATASVSEPVETSSEKAQPTPTPPPPPMPPVWATPADPTSQPPSTQEKKLKAKKKLPKYVNAVFNKVEINIVKASPGANPSGAPGSSQNAGPNSSSGLASPPANSRSADGLLFGQSEKTNGAYKAVFSTRQSLRVNPIMDEAGGVYQEKISIGSFANKGDNRSMNCHFRSLMDRKLNMSFSFDPHSLLCSNCPTRGGHPVGEGGGGGGGI
jgi:hypothetical protein